MKRRDFLITAALSAAAASCPGLIAALAGEDTSGAEGDASYDAARHLYGMGIDVDKCIGCGRCMEACRAENEVPPGAFRTWVERYTVRTDQSVEIECIGLPRKNEPVPEKDVLRTFFVPKLCNHCQNPPCAQVCPVGATFSTEDGVVIVDSKRCIGCRYCVQACPYGARFINPNTRTADKCTFCYHRVRKGLLPACVEVCPTQARVFGDYRSAASPLTRFQRMHKVHTLKTGLNTEPKVIYANLDGEVQ